ncbi:MAG: hypothetical protein CM1200mP39_06830 [Dehalococcoidia bacterium]|nr:MAG: hypothetical protein CM1200mP39_06830 [Dehalococcoidia bacterium]
MLARYIGRLEDTLMDGFYPGPIGAIVTPVITGLKDATNLPAASSLCGACHEACPVKINIPRMLLELRHKTAEGLSDPDERTSKFLNELFGKRGESECGKRSVRLGSRLAYLFMRPFSINGWIRKAPLLFQVGRYREISH